MRKINKKSIIILSISLSLLVLIIVLLAQNVSVGKGTDAHAAMSIAFDKKAMRSADRVMILAEDKEIEVTDPVIIGQIVDKTAAATHIKMSCPEDRQINVYCGDQLIRSMGWSTCADTVNVFDTDAAHWVMSIEGIEEGGSICLSSDLLATLNNLIRNN